MKKILIGYLSTGLGSGINKYIDSFCDQIKNEDVQIDFITRKNNEDIKEYVANGGFNKLYVVSRNRKPFKQYSEMIKIFKEGNYDIAYFNISETYDCIGVIAAKVCNVKKIIVHSHSSGVDINNFFIRKAKSFLNFCFKPIINMCCNKYLACSENAARWMFTKKVIKEKKYDLIYNTVDYKKFEYSEESRTRIRKELNIENKFVIGHVGRFSYQKNHMFILRVLKGVFEKNDNAVAILIGEGKLEKKVRAYAESLNILDRIIFLNNVPNVNEYMQAFDVLILPSKFEGLPIVGVEGQFSSVPCLFSDKISSDVIIGENSKLLTIDDPKIWEKNILDIEKRENNLNANAKKYMQANSKEQFDKILQEDDIIKENIHSKGLNFWFKIVLIIHFFLNLTCYMHGFNYLVLLCAILMIIIVGMNLKDYRKILKNKNYILLSVFLISYIISFVLTKKYNVVGSVKILIWSFLHFFFIFGYYHINSDKQAKKEITDVLSVIVAVISIINLDNAFLLLTRTSKHIVSFGKEPYIIGLSSWGRFYGNFYDPNYASVVCVCGIIFALYLLNKKRAIYQKILLMLSIILQLGYIFFSESRTGLVTLAVGGFTYILGRWIFVSKNRKVVSLILELTLAMVVVLVLPKMSLKVYNIVSNNRDDYRNIISKVDNKIELDDDDIEDDEDAEIKAKQKVVTIGRTDNKNDISNRRFDIWKSGIEIFSDNTVTGVGFPNILYIAREKYPNTYIVNNDFTEFNAFHNVIIDVVVSQGFVGVCIVIILFMSIFVDTIKYWRKFIKDDSEEKVMIISCLLAIIASSMFLSEIFYVNNACTFMFWLLFGYYNYYLDRSKYEK